MATDPSWQQDEKRRREAQARAAQQAQARQDLAARGSNIAAGAGSPADARYARLAELARPAPASRPFAPSADQRSLVRQGVDQALAPPPPARAPVNVRFRDQEVISPNPERRRAQGLTRIVKTADGAYTDAPGAEGTVRYYDQMGTRVDAAPVQGSRGARIGPREANRIMDQNQYDFAADPDLEQAAVTQGRRSIATLARRNAEGAARAAQMERAALPPEQRAALEATEMEQAGEDRRSLSRDQASLAAAQIQAQDAERARALELARMSGEVDWKHRERASDPETADAYIREEVGGLMQMTPSQRRAVLTDPDDPTAGRLREAINLRMREATGNPQANAAQATPTGGLRRWATAVNPFSDQHRYGDGAGWFGAGRGFDPSQWGLTDEMFEELFRDPAQDILIDPERALRRSMR